jgi:hypothetical protein
VPTHIRAQVSWNVGTLLPRDVMQITPCFRHHAVLPFDDPNWDQLASDLGTALDTWLPQPAGRQQTIKLYEIGQPEPNRPKATHVLHTNQSPEGSVPREVALCLSFHGGKNTKRERGRLYLPVWAVTNSASIGVRPVQATIDKCAELPAVFANLGGANVDWIIWSTMDNKAVQVTDWYVDDEWDTQRRRGLRSTQRKAGTTSG